MQPALLMLWQAGKWRYFLTGLAICLLAGAVCRAAGRLAGLLGRWRCFHGECTQLHANGAVTVAFSDRNRMQAEAVLFPAEKGSVQIGDTVQIAIRADLFEAGTYPQTAQDAEAMPEAVLPSAVQRKRVLRQFFRVLLIQLAVCVAAALLLLLTVKLCFPG